MFNTATLSAYAKLKGDDKLSADQSKTIDAVVETISVQTRELIKAKNWAELAKMPDEQRFKKVILTSLYPSKTSKNHTLLHSVICMDILQNAYFRHPSSSELR